MIILTTIISVYSLLSCQPQPGNKSPSTQTDSFVVTVAPYEKASTPVVFEKYPPDTLLPSGWQVRYYTKEDSTKDSDLYIECSNTSSKYTYKAIGVLMLRSFFVPRVIGESESCIYFRTSCGTGCGALFVFYKNGKKKFDRFDSIADYDMNSDVIVFISEDDYVGDKYVVSVANLRNHLIKKVRFFNQCNVLPRGGCIDSVSFLGSNLILYGTFNKGSNYYEDELVKEKQIVSLVK